MTDDAAAAEMVPLGPSDMSLLAERLVTSAQGQGIRLTGENGLLTALTRQVLKAALEAEMAQHLGFERGDPAVRGATNIRNGAYPKTVRTEIGEVTGRGSPGPAGHVRSSDHSQAPAPAGRVRRGGHLAVGEGDDDR